MPRPNRLEQTNQSVSTTKLSSAVINQLKYKSRASKEGGGGISPPSFGHVSFAPHEKYLRTKNKNSTLKKKRESQRCQKHISFQEILND